MASIRDFGLSEIVENHLPEWITGYACAGCANYPYKCPAGYKRTGCVLQAPGTHGCSPRYMVAFVICEQEGVAPPPTKGYLTVNTSPTGALVTVNGVSCGTTPVTRCELDTGTKTVTITKSGYNTVTRSVTIRAGETTDIGTITLTSTAAPPAEGETRELDIGEYEATWTLSGYDTLNARIEVKDTGVTCISVTAGACNSATPPGVTVSSFTVTGYLKSAVVPPTEGYLKVDTRPTGASVTVDGVSCGTTPVYACTLSVGTKTVTITKSGYNTVTRSVTITAGQTSDLGIITLTPTGVPPTKMTKSEFMTEIQNRGEIDTLKIPITVVEGNWWRAVSIVRYRLGSLYISMERLDARNPPTLEGDVYFYINYAHVESISRDLGITAINALPFVGVAPPPGVCDELIDDQSDTKNYGADIGHHYIQQLMTRVKRYLSKVVVQRKGGSKGDTVTCYIYNSDCSILIGSATAVWSDETEFVFSSPLDLNAYATYNICLKRTIGTADTRWSSTDGAFTGKYGASCCGANDYNYKLWLKTYGCEVPGVPTTGYLTLTTSPTGALVTVAGVSCGVTPVYSCELSTGSKTVTITKSGYNTVTRSVTITAGQTSDLGTITLTPTAAPPVEIGSWIDESGVTNLTPSHAMYVYYLSQGATGAADTKYAGLSPKPSRMDPSIATVDNAMGIFYYSQGAMGAGNAKTGLNY